MINKFYRIIKEANTFKRMSLTKVGFFDESIQEIYAFKERDKRYLRVSFNKEPSSDVLDRVNSRIDSMGDLKRIKEEFNEDLEAVYQKCVSKTETCKRLLYFDRDTYV